MLTLYRRLIALRRGTPALSVGSYIGLEAEGDVLAYMRMHAGQRCLMVLNLGSQPQVWEPRQVEVRGQIGLSTHLDRAAEPVSGAIELRGDEGVVVLLA
jgi:alpha-glucosidase